MARVQGERVSDTRIKAEAEAEAENQTLRMQDHKGKKSNKSIRGRGGMCILPYNTNY